MFTFIHFRADSPATQGSPILAHLPHSSPDKSTLGQGHERRNSLGVTNSASNHVPYRHLPARHPAACPAPPPGAVP